MNRVLVKAIDGAAVAVGGAIALSLLHNPAIGTSVLNRAAAIVGRLDSAWIASAWALAATSSIAAALLAVGQWRRSTVGGDPAAWDVSIDIPSWPVGLLTVGGLFAATAVGLTMCSDSSTWGLIPLLVAVWGAWRLVGGVRRQLRLSAYAL